MTRALCLRARVCREVLAMDGCLKTPGRPLVVARAGEPARLRWHWMNLAYEKLCPIHAPAIGPGPVMCQCKSLNALPGAAAGG